MPSNTTEPRQRVIVAKLTLDILRAFGEAHFRTERFGSRADDLLLYAGLFIGQTEGRPLNASKLAAYAGQSRSSVTRRLNSWLKAGLVERDGRTYRLAASVMHTRAVAKASRAAQKRVLAAAKALAPDQR